MLLNQIVYNLNIQVLSQKYVTKLTHNIIGMMLHSNITFLHLFHVLMK